MTWPRKTQRKRGMCTFDYSIKAMNNLQGLQLWLRLQRQRFHILRLDKVALGGWMSRYPRSYERDFYQLKCWWRRGRGVWMEIERNGPEIQHSCFEILIFTKIRDFWAVFKLTCSLSFDVQCHWMKKKLKTINIEMKQEFVNRKIWQTVHACTDVKMVQLVGSDVAIKMPSSSFTLYAFAI